MHPTNLTTTKGQYPLDLKLANGFFSRFRGLMLSRPLTLNQGLLITRCSSVHCAFMRYAIDVVYLDDQGRVTKCVRQLRPWHASVSSTGKDSQGKPYARAAHTLELAAGSIDRLHIRPGDQLDHPHWPARQLRSPSSLFPDDVHQNKQDNQQRQQRTTP